MSNGNKDHWIDLEIQASVIASLIRQYNRYVVADSYQIEHETMSFNDFHNQITVRGLVAYESELAEAEKLIEMQVKKEGV